MANRWWHLEIGTSNIVAPEGTHISSGIRTLYLEFEKETSEYEVVSLVKNAEIYERHYGCVVKIEVSVREIFESSQGMYDLKTKGVMFNTDWISRFKRKITMEELEEWGDTRFLEKKKPAEEVDFWR
jgi:hypothetical protein